MTDLNDLPVPAAPAILTPDVQQAVWFLGALVRFRAAGAATAGQLAILEHQAERGHCSPLHRHDADEETFFVLAAGSRATSADTRPEDELPPDPASLGALASHYNIEILGPPPAQ